MKYQCTSCGTVEPYEKPGLGLHEDYCARCNDDTAWKPLPKKDEDTSQGEAEDTVDMTLYAINSDMQAEIKEIMNILQIDARKRQNINHVNISVKIRYFPKEGVGNDI